MNSEDYVTREELQAAERLTKVESAVDSHTDFVKFSHEQHDRQILIGTRMLFALIFIVLVALSGFIYQTVAIGRNLSEFRAEVSANLTALRSDVTQLQSDMTLVKEKLEI